MAQNLQVIKGKVNKFDIKFENSYIIQNTTAK